jgi:hypothetical protein
MAAQKYLANKKDNLLPGFYCIDIISDEKEEDQHYEEEDYADD